MPEQKGRFEWLVKTTRIGAAAFVGLLAVGIILTVAMAVITYHSTGDWQAIVPWLFAALTCAVHVVWVMIAYGLILVLTSSEESAAISAGRLGRVETLLDELSNSARKIIDLTSMSDRAKGLIFREHEIEALREAINHDLMSRDFESAQQRITNIEQIPGFAAEASRLREAVELSRKATQEEQLDAAVKRVQSVIDRSDWVRAGRETQRLVQFFPDHTKVKELPERLEEARNARKKDLLQKYGEAARKQDIDGSIALLHELDAYLTPQEAAALQESARGVFRAKLHNLGVQFAIHVTDKRWSEAIATGDEIIRSYPNSRMAQEVREKMEQLKVRARKEDSGPMG